MLPGCPNDACLGDRRSLALTAFTAIACLVALWRKSRFLTIASLAGLSLLNVNLADRRIFYFDTAEREQMRARASMVYVANSAVRNRDPRRDMLYWFDVQEPYGAVYQSLAAMNLRNIRMVSASFPEYSAGAGTSFRRRGVTGFQNGETVVIPSILSEATVTAEADTVLADSGRHLEPFARDIVSNQAGAFNLWFARVEPGARTIAPAPGVPLPFDSLTTTNGATAVHTATGGLHINTPAAPWGYAALIRLDGAAGGVTEAGYIEVRVEKSSPNVGIGILDREQRGFLAREEIPADGAPPYVLRLRVSDLSQASSLVVQAWGGAAAGSVELSSITLHRGRR